MDAKLNPLSFLAMPPPASGRPAAWLAALKAAFGAGLRRWAEGLRSSPFAAGADELLAMSDRDLQDLGIGRGEVPRLLAGGREARLRRWLR